MVGVRVGQSRKQSKKLKKGNNKWSKFPHEARRKGKKSRECRAWSVMWVNLEEGAL